jgi:enediyne biosynthesis protein E3
VALEVRTNEQLAPGKAIMAWLRRRAFGIPIAETTCARRGFHVSDAGVRRQLEQIGQTFVHGYHGALDNHDPAALAPWLNAIEEEYRGFAYEGAAMALALLDQLTPWNRHRLPEFLAGLGAPHVYMAHVGAGWAFARLCRNIERPLARLDPLLGWLTIDGYGFHEGYFHWRRYLERQAYPSRLSGYARCVFDQGLGRSLWFVCGADVARIPVVIATFAPVRRADLWSGVGLACSYAGGATRAALAALRAAAGPHHAHLAQGAAFAAKARQRAATPALHTEIACEVLCHRSAAAAAAITDWALKDLVASETAPAYEVWRQRIRQQLIGEVVSV